MAELRYPLNYFETISPEAQSVLMAGHIMVCLSDMPDHLIVPPETRVRDLYRFLKASGAFDP